MKNLKVRRSRNVERMNVDGRAKEPRHIAGLTHQIQYIAVEFKRGNARNHIGITIVPR